MSSDDLVMAAFGEWSPAKDPNAALKFCLNTVITGGDFDWLVDILQATQSLQFQGDPGWELERRLECSDDPEWPNEAEFRARVPDGLVGIEHNEVFVDYLTFAKTLRSLLEEYKKRPCADEDDSLKQLAICLNALA